jgi:hypothetical protein
MLADAFFKVTGYTLRESGFTPSVRTDYEFLVAFKSWEDNRTQFQNYLAWYLEWDEKSDGQPYHLFNNEKCAEGLGVFFLREQSERLLDVDAVRLHSPIPPDRPPDASDSGYRLWLLKETYLEVYTESNAGWDLYARCRYSKLSVEEARSLTHAKFGGKLYSWEEVLYWFRKHGGRHTEKYLRVDG